MAAAVFIDFYDHDSGLCMPVLFLQAPPSTVSAISVSVFSTDLFARSKIGNVVHYADYL